MWQEGCNETGLQGSPPQLLQLVMTLAKETEKRAACSSWGVDQGTAASAAQPPPQSEVTTAVTAAAAGMVPGHRPASQLVPPLPLLQETAAATAAPCMASPSDFSTVAKHWQSLGVNMPMCRAGDRRPMSNILSTTARQHKSPSSTPLTAAERAHAGSPLLLPTCHNPFQQCVWSAGTTCKHESLEQRCQQHPLGNGSAAGAAHLSAPGATKRAHAGSPPLLPTCHNPCQQCVCTARLTNTHERVEQRCQQHPLCNRSAAQVA